MPYLSEFLGKVVVDADGQRVGTIKDVLARATGASTHPQVVALAIGRDKQTHVVPLSAVQVLIAPVAVLNGHLSSLSPYVAGEQDLHLVRDMLDKEIIDTNGVRVVRVNDLELARINNHYFLANVDRSGLGILRRLGLARHVEALARRFGRPMRPTLISWDHVELLPGGQARLRVSRKHVSDLSPADLATIISDMTPAESSKFAASLDIEQLADTMEEVEPDLQATLLDSMPEEKAADVLEEMAPDEAADLLAELPEEQRTDLLNLMEKDEAEDVRRLLAYAENSAGGLMNTEFAAVRPNLTAADALAALRQTANDAEMIFYIYVTDEEGRLAGVFSLQDLVLAQPETPVADFMHSRVVTVKPDDDQETVAQLISKYNLLAIPVLDDERRMLGFVSADDALDKMIPTAWKKRLPRFYR